VAAGSVDNTIRIWDVATGQERLTLSGHTDWVGNIAFSPDGTSLASTSRDGSVRLWDVASGKQRSDFAFEAPMLDANRRAWTNGLAFAPDGSVIAVGATDRMVYILDAKTGKQLHQLAGHRNWIVIRGLVFSSDSKTLYSSGLDGNILVWDAQSGSQLKQLSRHELGVVGLSLSADGKRLASVSDQEGVMLIWDTAAASVIGQLQTGQGVVLSLQYSPDSEILGLTGYNGSVRLIRLLDLDSAQGFGGSARSEQSIAFLPDARIVVITSDGTVVIVDLTTGNSTTLAGLDGQPIGVVTSRSGKYVAAGSNSGNVVIWNAADGKQLTTIKTSSTAAQLLEFNYSGDLL
ncbi:MAG TPA: PQQ-binding-like beta-propeller repeat protein, partial [Roseiflexaceae bacterium]|nr:PQQ-binding-like beta-propeller repeat protein [Roseiflexaceae bacterium]